MEILPKSLEGREWFPEAELLRRAAGLVVLHQLKQSKKVLMLLCLNKEGVCTFRSLLLSPHFTIWDLVQFWWKCVVWECTHGLSQMPVERLQEEISRLVLGVSKLAAGQSCELKCTRVKARIVCFYIFFKILLFEMMERFVLFCFFWLNDSKISALSGMKIWGETINNTLGGGDFYLKKKKILDKFLNKSKDSYHWCVNMQTIYLRKDKDIKLWR